jgi:hypothetical protein
MCRGRHAPAGFEVRKHQDTRQRILIPFSYVAGCYGVRVLLITSVYQVHNVETTLQGNVTT